MKHPILYRLGFYSAIVILSATILFLLNLMNGAPFKSIDMRSAYFHGCNFGGIRPLSTEHVFMCVKAANTYKDTLDDLDKQMDNLDGND